MVGLMLTIQANSNTGHFDTLRIHNVGYIDKWEDICEYEIVTPTGYDDIKLLHRRSDGWMELLRKALNEMAVMDSRQESITALEREIKELKNE